MIKLFSNMEIWQASYSPSDCVAERGLFPQVASEDPGILYFWKIRSDAKNDFHGRSSRYGSQKKLMISDVKSKGLVISPDRLERILQSARISYSIDEKGIATENAEVNGMLTAAGITYDEFENQYFREDQEYSKLQFDYWYLIYQEETGKNGHAQPIEEVESVVIAHLNSLLAELKYSR